MWLIDMSRFAFVASIHNGRTYNAGSWRAKDSTQPVREAVSYRGLFTAGWFGVKEKHCFRLEIYDRLRASEQAEYDKQPVRVPE